MSYHWVYWFGLIVVLIAALLTKLFVPESPVKTPAKIDWGGAALLSGGLIAALVAISEGNDWGWTSGGVIALFAAAVVLCGLWVVIEQRVREPLVRLSLLVGARSLSANVVSALLGFSMFAAFTLIAGFVQSPSAQLGYGLDGSVLDVGLYMLPSTVTMLLFSWTSGRIAARIGTAYTLAIGSAFAGLCYVWLAVSNSHVYDMLAFSAIQGIGFGIAYAALGTLAAQHVPMDQSGIASGINSLVRTTGGSVAGAVTASILAGKVIAGTQVPTLGAYELCFWIVAAGAFAAALVAVAHGLRHPD
jgi:hypothetical protein